MNTARFLILVLLAFMLVGGLFMSFMVVGSGQVVAQDDPTATPEDDDVAEDELPEITLEFYDRNYEDAIDELQDLELISEGGGLIFETDNSFRFGEGAYFWGLTEGRNHNNFVFAADVEFTTSAANPDELEECGLMSRIQRNQDGFVDNFLLIGFDRDGYVFMFDLFDPQLFDDDREAGSVEDELATDLDFDESHHVLIIADGTIVSVFVDGELMLQHEEITERRGFHGIALQGQGGTARCEASDLWIWELDSSWDEDDGVCGVAADGDINKRSGPGTDFDRAGQLFTDAVAGVIGQAMGEDGFVWWQLEDESWVRSDLVDVFDGTCESASEVAVE